MYGKVTALHVFRLEVTSDVFPSDEKTLLPFTA